MKYVFVGDIHGNINQFVETIAPLNPDIVIQAGDFGIWPDPLNVDRATRRHGGAGDFPLIWARKQPMPFPVIFTHGNHDDMIFLERFRKTKQILPNLKYVHTGVTRIGKLKIAFLGGNYSYKHKQPRHIKPWDADTLKYTKFDVLVTHDCAQTTPVKVFGPMQRDKEGNIILPGSPDILEILKTSNPQYYFHGHYHQRVETMIDNTKVIGLNSIPHPFCYHVLEA